jgi:putative glutamine amidotransferase
MKKLVGMTCGREFKDGAPRRQYVHCSYVRAVAEAGAPAILLPGGIDVEPHRYGRKPHPKLGECDGSQDAFEIAIAREAWRRRMPIFAICRGIQLLNVALGGTLIQDLPSEAPSGIAHRQEAGRSEATHDIRVDRGSRLFRLTGERMAVNSFHHQAVDGVAPDLRVVARAPDGVVEAVESEAHPRLIAVQCHPEEMAGCDPVSRSLFRQFVEWL